MAAFVLLLHLVGWGVLALIVAPRHYLLGSAGVFGVGLGVTAYTLGMRHAFDADHIAAIDNTTRKLMADGRRPLSVGFWFSLGHSTVVFVLCFLLGIGVRTLAGQVADDSSRAAAAHRPDRYGGLRRLPVPDRGPQPRRPGRGGQGVPPDAHRRVRRGRRSSSTSNNRGLMNRILAGVTKAVTRPWQMYPIGLLFGLGFDTATEVSLLVLAGGAAAFSLPWYAVLTLPILFAAGMSLLDTIDGCLMNFAYGWAFAKPVRKVYYNITITGLSVAVALVIGSIELISILTDKLHIDPRPARRDRRRRPELRRLRDRRRCSCSPGSPRTAIWKYARIEEKWSTAR